MPPTCPLPAPEPTGAAATPGAHLLREIEQLRAERFATAVLSGATGALAGYIVFVLKIGPVIAVLSERHGHGVHSGDLIAIPLGVLSLASAAACWRADARLERLRRLSR